MQISRPVLIIASIVYGATAFAVFDHDRAMGRAKCWKSDFNNSAFSSFFTALYWPAFAAGVGVMTVLGASVAPYTCGNQLSQP